MGLPMPTISKDGLQQIRDAALPVRQTLYDLEAQYKAIQRRLPKCFAEAMQECLASHHQALTDLRGAILENLDIEPLTETQISLMGGPGTK